MSYDIHLLAPDNAGLLSKVATDVFDNAIDSQQLQAFIEDDRHLLVFATDGDTVVGMASAFEYFHPDKSPQMFINEVGVASTHRKRGIGRSLVEALIREAKSRGCVFAWLGTEADNQAGQACFSSVPGVAQPQPFLLYAWDLED